MENGNCYMKKNVKNKKNAKSDIQKYCQYLIKCYVELNDKASGGSLYCNMEQFVEEGRIKDLFEKNKKIESKINFMHIFRRDILFYAKQISTISFKKVKIKKYKTFIKHENRSRK